MRSALRAYALESPDPAEVLAKLDRTMQHFEPGVLATVLYAVLDPALHCALASSAGHLPPVVAAPGQPSELADVHADLLIGVIPGVQRRSVRIEIPPGGLLALYTDGLVERREAALDVRLSDLRDVVAPASAEAVCSAVMGALVGSERARDDIALLVLRRRYARGDREPQLS